MWQSGEPVATVAAVFLFWVVPLVLMLTLGRAKQTRVATTEFINLKSNYWPKYCESMTSSSCRRIIW